jgi:hypothetical protein
MISFHASINHLCSLDQIVFNLYMTFLTVMMRLLRCFQAEVCISREALRNIMSVINSDNTTKAGSTTGGTSTAAGSDEGLDTTEDPWCDPPAYKVREGCDFAGCTVTRTSHLWL